VAFKPDPLSCPWRKCARQSWKDGAAFAEGQSGVLGPSPNGQVAVKTAAEAFARSRARSRGGFGISVSTARSSCAVQPTAEHQWAARKPLPRGDRGHWVRSSCEHGSIPYAPLAVGTRSSGRWPGTTSGLASRPCRHRQYRRGLKADAVSARAARHAPKPRHHLVATARLSKPVPGFPL